MTLFYVIHLMDDIPFGPMDGNYTDASIVTEIEAKDKYDAVIKIFLSFSDFWDLNYLDHFDDFDITYMFIHDIFPDLTIKITKNLDKLARAIYVIAKKYPKETTFKQSPEYNIACSLINKAAHQILKQVTPEQLLLSCKTKELSSSYIFISEYDTDILNALSIFPDMASWRSTPPDDDMISSVPQKQQTGSGSQRKIRKT